MGEVSSDTRAGSEDDHSFGCWRKERFARREGSAPEDPQAQWDQCQQPATGHGGLGLDDQRFSVQGAPQRSRQSLEVVFTSINLESKTLSKMRSALSLPRTMLAISSVLAIQAHAQ